MCYCIIQLKNNQRFYILVVFVLLERNNVLINESELNRIKDNEIVKKALEIFVLNKLISDGYFYAKGCVENWKLENVKESLKIYYSKKDDIKANNTIDNFLTIMKTIKNNSKNYLDDDKYSFTIAKSIMYLILNIKDGKETDIKKDEYANIIFSLINNDLDLKTKDGFITLKDIDLINIKKLSTFISEIEEMDNSQFFYRGHSDVNYISQPSIFRNGYYKYEYYMYQELVVRCQENFVNCNSHFDFLKLMQHYGLPTRLLDLTLNPLVALYFACENDDEVGEVIVYSVDTGDIKYEKSDTLTIISCLPMFKYDEQQMIFENRSNFKSDSIIDDKNIVSRFMDEIHIEKPSFTLRIDEKDFCQTIFVMATRNNHRIYNQKGAFAAFGLPENKFTNDKTANNPINNYRYRKNGKKVIYYIESKIKGKILKELKKIGIDKSYIYPEIDDVADDIKNSI